MKLFVTPFPAFYKINLYNRINEKTPIKVVFIKELPSWRNEDFLSGSIAFKFIWLKGSFLKKIFDFIMLLSKEQHYEVFVSGWNELLYWIAVLLSPKEKNSVVVESSIFESSTVGCGAFLKKIFLKRISKAYVSGTPHKRLLKELGFKHEIIVTKGVGVFNVIDQPLFIPRKEVRNFIYVGRLVKVKNLFFLIERFNCHPELSLTIVGFGDLEEELKKTAAPNINFTGAIDNKLLPSYYQNADVFILPSLAEPWGLVVEEALNNGLPVMLSDQVGCHEDLVNENTGVVFSLTKDSFEFKLEEIRNISRYNKMREYISHLNFVEIEKNQVDCYIR